MSERVLQVDRAAIPVAVQEICARLRGAGHGAWVVGGCVRDHLLGRAVSDWDICTSARPDAVVKLFPKVVPTGIAHGTVTVVHQREHYEVTTLRGERGHTDGRRPDEVYFLDDVTDDLARRDFTVNAIAYDPHENLTVDPFDGRGDLARRVLRAVGDPLQRFREDGLRILRGARFAATLEFALDPQTEAAFAPTLDVFRKVSAERVHDEWMKAMKAARPSVAFEIMLRTGILAVTCPALVALVGLARDGGGDAWAHSLDVLDRMRPGDAVLRLAGLVHDVGLAGGRDGHGARGAAIVDAWMKQYKFANDERARVTHLVKHHAVDLSPTQSAPTLRRFVRAVGVGAIDDLLQLVTANMAAVDGGLEAVDAFRARLTALQGEGFALSTRDLALDGAALMSELGIPPSKAVGETLATLLERVTDDPSQNSREQLLTIARALIAARA